MMRFSSIAECDSHLSIKIPNPDLVMEEETLETYDESPQTNASKEENPWRKQRNNKKKSQVCLEGYIDTVAESEEIQELGSKVFSRTKSLRDGDLDELKGCVDLGFGFSYEKIPELCNTLPALELCYSMNQRFLDDQHKASSETPDGSPIANWRISSPGDHPEEVKARLKFWAQAVACTVKLCS